MSKDNPHIILCGGISLPRKFKGAPSSHILRLTYDASSSDQNVSIELPHFIKNVNCHFPNRIKDLLEIAGYVYAADRLVKRGTTSSLEYHNWSRFFHFVINVRDYAFWNKKGVHESLDAALTFVSGDIGFQFTFLKGGKDVGQTNLFDREGYELEKKPNSIVALFSGGLDSLAGIFEVLETSDRNLILVSHRSNNSAITQIQEGIFRKLNNDYPGRLQYFPFYCSLHGERAVEETQRTRIFLYTSIAHSLSALASDDKILVFENGITSINFYKRQDLINSRSSRTTHPKTLKLLEGFYNKVDNKDRKIVHPFLYNTKTDIFQKIKSYGKSEYINSTISCTKTFQKFQNRTNASHCGGCSQCIDRRFAAFASCLEEYDAIYDIDISNDEINSEESRTHLYDYINLVSRLNELSEINFPFETLDILTDIVPFLEGNINTEKISKIYKLTQRHTNQVLTALQRIRLLSNPLKPKKKNSLHSYIDDRVYLRPSVNLLIDRIVQKLTTAIPEACNHAKPGHENSLNDIINALLLAEREDYEREFPALRFSIARVIPDHSFAGIDLLIEAKYLRGKTAKSAITDGIAADITKYPIDKHKLFVIYDPERKIPNDDNFRRDFEQKPNCYISIIR